MPETEYASVQALTRVEERLSKEIEANKASIQNACESIIKLEVMYQALAALPAAIASLEKTMVGVQQNLEGMNSKIDYMQDKLTNQKASIKGLEEENKQQNEQIAKIDDKGKIDWIEAISKNFWKVLVAVGALYYLGKDIVSAIMKG